MLVRLLQASLALTFMVILLGAYTRLADAGLGCPDWPGCYGQLLVPTEVDELKRASELYPNLTVEADKAWLEMVHRYMAGILGLLVYGISYLAIQTRQGGWVLPIGISLVVVAQAALGMFTVTMMLMPVVVMGHLLGGFTLFSMLAMLYWRVTSPTRVLEQSSGNSVLKLVAFTSLIVVIGQVALGGWTSSNYAALMCTELPICQGGWQSHLDFETAFQLIQPPQESYEFGTLDYGARMTIHVAHRFGAGLVTVMCLLLAAILWRQSQAQYQRQAWCLIALLLLQIALGVSNVLFSLPITVAVAHNLGAALLLINVLHVNYLAWQSVSLRSEASLAIYKESHYE